MSDFFGKFRIVYIDSYPYQYIIQTVTLCRYFREDTTYFFVIYNNIVWPLDFCVKSRIFSYGKAYGISAGQRDRRNIAWR